MAEIPDFWDTGPHEALPVEETLHKFVQSVGGKVIADLLPKSPSFDNADYLFEADGVVAELKEIRTEFTRTESFSRGLRNLVARVIREDPAWRPGLLGGDGTSPPWFGPEFVKLAHDPVARILKKANRQIRETKAHFGLSDPTGILLLANDGFVGIDPHLVFALASQMLARSYSSIDCFVYLTVNRYVEIEGSNTPRLLWFPSYSDRAAPSLDKFVNTLGRRWFDFLEDLIGPFTVPKSEREVDSLIRGRAIILPDERR